MLVCASGFRMQEEGIHGANRLDTRAELPLVVVTTQERGAQGSMGWSRAIASGIGSEISHWCSMDPGAPWSLIGSGSRQRLLAPRSTLWSGRRT